MPIQMKKKRSEETQTLHAGCSKAEPNIFAPLQIPLFGGTGWPKFNQLEILSLQSQFGEDQCIQFRVIMVTDPQTQPYTHRQDRLQYMLRIQNIYNVWGRL